MTQWHSTNAHSIRAHARVALAVCLLGKSKVQAQWPFLFAPLLRRLCGRCFTGSNLTLTWARLQNGRAYGSGSISDFGQRLSELVCLPPRGRVNSQRL
jgi:hypothetical protein